MAYNYRNSLTYDSYYTDFAGAERSTAIPPDGVAAVTNMTGTYTDVDDDPDSADASRMEATTPSSTTSVRLTFESPPENLTVGANYQEFRIRIRKAT